MLKQLFFKYITNPIAKFLDFFNIKKRCLLEHKRNLIALHNRNDYIETTSKMLLEARIIKDISEGRRVDPIEVPEIIWGKTRWDARREPQMPQCRLKPPIAL